jgi:hypothetical protein
MICPRLQQQLLEAHSRAYHQPAWRRTARATRTLVPVPLIALIALVLAICFSSARGPQVDRALPGERPAATATPAVNGSTSPDLWGERRDLTPEEAATLRANFGVLRRAQTTKDTLPERRDTARDAIDPSFSRLVAKDGAVRIYLGVASYRGGLEVCGFAFVNAGGAGSSDCVSLGAATRPPAAGTFSSSLTAQGQLLFGIVPDRVQRGTFTYDDSSRVERTVTNNVLFSLEDTLPRSVETTDNRGATQAVVLTDLR